MSVSRTFGDIEAKIPELGGMPGVVVCNPDVNYLPNGANEMDFIVIGSDGIFDKLKTSDINEIVWSVINEYKFNPQISLH